MTRGDWGGLEERVRCLEVGFEWHAKELERLRLRLALSEEEMGPDLFERDTGSAIALGRDAARPPRGRIRWWVGLSGVPGAVWSCPSCW